MNEAYILAYYQKLAKNFGESPLMSISDQFIRDAETEFIRGEIKRFQEEWEFNPQVLDLGCGNGYQIKRQKNYFPQCNFYGIEFTPELFQLANIEGKIKLLDMRKLPWFSHKFDIIYSERSIINLYSWNFQEQALKNIGENLRPGGLYIMMESFKESLHQLNRVKKELGVITGKESKHNLFLTESVVKTLKKIGLFEKPGVMPKNYLSSHYFLSRVFYQFLKPKGGRGKDSLLVEFFRHSLPSSPLHYSPIQFRVFQKGDK